MFQLLLQTWYCDFLKFYSLIVKVNIIFVFSPNLRVRPRLTKPVGVHQRGGDSSVAGRLRRRRLRRHLSSPCWPHARRCSGESEYGFQVKIIQFYVFAGYIDVDLNLELRYSTFNENIWRSVVVISSFILNKIDRTLKW